VFIGHTAIALAAKRARPSVPLAALIAAAYGPDVIEITLLALWRWARVQAAFGSHSIPSVALGAATVAAGYWIWRRDGPGAALLAATYASHWVADLFTGKGKPTWGGGPGLGLQLYEHPVLDFVLESALLVVAWVVCWPAGDRRRKRRAAHLVTPIVLLLVQLVFNASEHLFGVRSIKGVLSRASGGAVSSAPGGVDAFCAAIGRRQGSAATCRPARRMRLAWLAAASFQSSEPWRTIAGQAASSLSCASPAAGRSSTTRRPRRRT
jgi:hypothetical protein